MNDHLIQNTPDSLGKQFLQGKEKITCTDMENTPALQCNETSMDTCTFIPGSTTLSRHLVISTSTHPRIVTQNFQQLEKESSNMMALPGFKHNAETATHVETSRNVHSNGAPSTSLNTYTNTYANMDTNHTAHRPLPSMAHRYRHTRKEAHLLSRSSELQPTEDPETQKLDSAHVQQTRQEYSRLTEINKAKFQNPFIYNEDRNFVRHNSVSKISPNPTFMTTQNTSSVLNSVFCRKKGRKRGRCRDSRNCRRTCTCTYSRRTCTCTCSHTGDSP